MRHSGEEEEVSLADFPAEANRMNWNEKMSEYCPRAAAPLWEVKGWGEGYLSGSPGHPRLEERGREREMSLTERVRKTAVDQRPGRRMTSERLNSCVQDDQVFS